MLNGQPFATRLRRFGVRILHPYIWCHNNLWLFRIWFNLIVCFYFVLIQLFFILFCLNKYNNFLTSGLRELHDPSSSERGHGGKTRLEWHRAGIDWIIEAISHRLIINNFYITWKITKITLTLHVTFESFKIKLSF